MDIRMKPYYFIILCLMFLTACSPDAMPGTGGTDTVPGTGQEEQRYPGYTYMSGGRLYDADGKELALWGVNFQPCISWEYHDRLWKRNLPETAEMLKSLSDTNIPELHRMGVNVLRCHLTPADFTDAEGNLVETIYLESLDYMVHKAKEYGMYVTLAFVNHMNDYAYVPESFMCGATREDWINDPGIVEQTRNYVRQLMQHRNPYTGLTYAEEKDIVYWELVNEPSLYGWPAIQEHENAYNAFKDWLAETGREENANAYYIYRQFLVQDYIDGMCGLLDECGAHQPVIWNMNWAHYRSESTMDIFDGTLSSQADGVCVCNYLDSSMVPGDAWNNPVDLSDVDFTSSLNNPFNNINGYGWLRSPEWSGKAKTIYEFETLFNDSAYLYPIQAQYFRALNMQSATMWTYCMKEYAQWYAGAQYLNLTSTPAKAASFIVAKAIFENTPIGRTYDPLVNEQIGENYAISKANNSSVWSDSEKFYHSGDALEWCPVPVSDEVNSIVGIGNSQIVEYSGTGIYFIDDIDGKLHITLEPNHEWVGEPWNSKNPGITCNLDYDTANTLSIRLKDWGEGQYTVSRIEDGAETVVTECTALENLSLAPGDYVVTGTE